MGTGSLSLPKRVYNCYINLYLKFRTDKLRRNIFPSRKFVENRFREKNVSILRKHIVDALSIMLFCYWLWMLTSYSLNLVVGTDIVIDKY